MENKLILNSTELTGIMGKEEMEKLSIEVGQEKWSKYREEYDQASNLKNLDFPIQLDFELNSSCNMRCPMCPISAESPKGKGKKTWFDFDFFKEILTFSVKKGTKAIKSTPQGNTILKDLAKEIINQENLGQDENTDIFTISFSATDYVGHEYGPHAEELVDTYTKLDKDLAVEVIAALKFSKYSSFLLIY